MAGGSGSSSGSSISSRQHRRDAWWRSSRCQRASWECAGASIPSLILCLFENSHTRTNRPTTSCFVFGRSYLNCIFGNQTKNGWTAGNAFGFGISLIFFVQQVHYSLICLLCRFIIGVGGVALLFGVLSFGPVNLQMEQPKFYRFVL